MGKPCHGTIEERGKIRNMQPAGYAGDHACIRDVLREEKPAGITSRNTRENLNHVTGGEWGEHATDANRGENDAQ